MACTAILSFKRKTIENRLNGFNYVILIYFILYPLIALKHLK